jgi:hypothetical protein
MTKAKALKIEAPLLTTKCATTPAQSVTRGVMLVTPALAEEWLSHNAGNRVIDPGAVERIASIIRAGRWRTTHQGIAIGADGMLYDGQHRLSAIVASGQSVLVEVTTGFVAHDLAAIDSNIGKGPRRPRDILKMSRGLTLSHNECAALVWAHSLVLARISFKVTAEVLEIAEKNHGDEFAAISSVLPAGTPRVGSAPVFGSLMVAWRSAPADAIAFAGMLRSGVDLSEGHPALTLRNHLLVRDRIGGSTNRTDVSAKTFSAFAAFVRGSTLKKSFTGSAALDHYVAAWSRIASKSL